MRTSRITRRDASVVSIGLALASATRAHSIPTIRVAFVDTISALPLFAGLETAAFSRRGLDVVPIRVGTAAEAISGLQRGVYPFVANLVVLEAAAANLLAPRTALFFALNGQGLLHPVEQFIVHNKHAVSTLGALRGARIASAPGPANVAVARAALRQEGLLPQRDYYLIEMTSRDQLEALASHRIDAAYAIEPFATLGVFRGLCYRLETGVIANRILNREDKDAFVAGAVVHGDFAARYFEITQAFAEAWKESITSVKTDMALRVRLMRRWNIPDDIAAAVPIPNFQMLRDFSAEDLIHLQDFVNFGVRENVLARRIDIFSFLFRV